MHPEFDSEQGQEIYYEKNGGDVGETGEGSPLRLPDDCEGLKLARHAVSHKDNLRTILIERRRVSAGNLLSLGRVDRHPAFVKGSFTS